MSNNVECVRAGPDVISMHLPLAREDESDPESESESSELRRLCMGLGEGMCVFSASLDKVLVQSRSFAREDFRTVEVEGIDWKGVIVRCVGWLTGKMAILHSTRVCSYSSSAGRPCLIRRLD